jgi:hypothetical protein
MKILKAFSPFKNRHRICIQITEAVSAYRHTIIKFNSLELFQGGTMKKSNLKAFKPFAILSGLFMLISFIFGGMSVFADELPPQVYINNIDKPVQVVRGQSIEIPVLIVGGYAEHQQSEMYIWREQGSDTYCFDGNEWTLVSGNSTDCEPLVVFSALPHHVYWPWSGLSSAEDLENCILYICFDDMIDGVLTEEFIHCGTCDIEVSENSSGSSSSVDNEPGSGSQSGSSSDQTSGPSQGGLTPPSFPASSGGGSSSSNQCDSLSYTKEGEMSSWSKSVVLSAGGYSLFNVSAQACGKNVSVTSVSATSVSAGGESRMSVNKVMGSQQLYELRFEFNATGLSAGQYTSTVNVTAGGVSDSFTLYITVQGECNADSVFVQPSTLSFSVVQGYDSNPQYVEVKNGCGESIDISEIEWNHHDWLNVVESTQGKLKVSILSSEQIGSYEDSITFKDSLKGETHTVQVSLTVGSMPTPTAGDITYVSAPVTFRNLSLDKREVLYFKFRAGVSEGGGPISIGTTPSHSAGFNVNMVVQRGGTDPPDVDDYEWTKGSVNDGDRELFWNHKWNAAQERRITIREPMEPQDFYIMLYNDSDVRVPGGQMLKIAWH